MGEPIDAGSMRIPLSEEHVEWAKNVALEMAVTLGESPEAWRGAAMMASFIKAGIGEELRESVEAGAPDLSYLARGLILVMAHLEDFPMWDHDTAGTPLNGGIVQEER